MVVAIRLLAPFDVQVLTAEFFLVEGVEGILGLILVVELYEGEVPLVTEVALAKLFEFVLQVAERGTF